MPQQRDAAQPYPGEYQQDQQDQQGQQQGYGYPYQGGTGEYGQYRY